MEGERPLGRVAQALVAIPLRGYVVCNPEDYGLPRRLTMGRNPLTGLCRLQPDNPFITNDPEVASQSPYGAMSFATYPLRTPFWTALSEGGL